MKIIKSKRYMRFMSLGDKSRSFIREKPLISSSIIHNNKTITITIFMASRSCRKRRSINMFQFVKPIQGSVSLTPETFYFRSIYISIDIDRYTRVLPDRIHGKPTTNHEAIDRTTSSTCVSRNIHAIRQISLLSRGPRHLTDTLGS